MKMIRDALEPEMLEEFRRLERAEAQQSSEEKAAALERRLREEADDAAEAEDRNRHERRRATALARHAQKEKANG